MVFDDAALGLMLRTECAAVSSFIALLRDEQSALVNGDIERLGSYAEAKSGNLFELTRLRELRVRWLRERGWSADRAGMAELLREQAAGAAQSGNLWRQLLELTQKAHYLNAANGGLIGARLNTTQRALNVIFAAANIAGGAYAPDGRAVPLRAAHELAVV